MGTYLMKLELQVVVSCMTWVMGTSQRKVFIAVMNHHGQKASCGKKGYFVYTSTCYSPLSNYVRAGTEGGNHKAVTNAEAMEEGYFLACSSCLAQPALL